MAIARKPKAPDAPPVPAVNVEALIAKGGSVARPVEAVKTEEPAETKSFTLRVPTEILETLDTYLKKQVVKVPRQQWIIEAVMQRLERDSLPHAPKD